MSLHAHERIDPRTIIQAVRAKEKDKQPSLFELERNTPLRKAIAFKERRTLKI